MSANITRSRLMTELVIKNVMVVIIFVGLYAPLSIGTMQNMPPEVQESMISLMGFLMAAAPIVIALVLYDFWDALRALDDLEH